MCNSWILLCLLFCCGNNGLGSSFLGNCGNTCCNNNNSSRNSNSGCGCNNSCGTTRANDNDCDSVFPSPASNNCGCDNDFIQPRGFFTGTNTCGCETNQSNE